MDTTRRIKAAAAAFALAGALGLVGCSSDSTSDTTVAAGDSTMVGGEIELEDMWARTSPMATTMGAAYLSVTSPVDDALLDVKVDPSVAGMAQIHETVMVDGSMSSDSTMAGHMGSDTTMAGGEMKMQEVDKVDLPAGTKVELKPGGYHIMLMELVKPLETGTTITLTLVFENAGEKTVEFPVMEDAPSES